MFVASRGDELILADREGLEIPLALSADGEADRAVQQLSGLAEHGIQLRSRALLTTLAARLLFGDLFLHGIGGAKYDRLTDAIIRRFFGIEPPAYMVVSGTLRLPIERECASESELFAVQRQLRELTFHPERFVDGAIAAPRARRAIHCAAASPTSKLGLPRQSLPKRRAATLPRNPRGERKLAVGRRAGAPNCSRA